MIFKNRLLKILHNPHKSEKTTKIIKKYNTIVMKVVINATKAEIKAAMYELFKIKINNVRTLIIKGKKKNKTKHNKNYYSNWKKAYITIKKGQDINPIVSIEE